MDANRQRSMYRLLGCGSNGLGQLGNGGFDDADVLGEAMFNLGRDESVVMEAKPVRVAGGGNHTVVLFDNGDVYGAGDNSSGQLGLGDAKNYSKFQKIPLDRCKLVLCGWEFSVFVTENDEIYTCGRGGKGELGMGTKKEALLENVASISDIVDLRSSLSHTVIRTKDNQLYGWGTSRKGELGHVGGAKFIDTPTKLDFSLPSDWKFYAVGRNRTVFLHDKVIINSQEEHEFPSDVISAAHSLRSMWTSVHIATDSQIFSHGNNSHGQLCSQQVPFTAMETGSEHGLLVTTDRRVLAWGWGEHGNCGRQDGPSVVYDMNCIFTGDAVMVAGGCATTWVVERVT